MGISIDIRSPLFWSIFSAAVIAAFWMIWRIYIGPVPEINTLAMTDSRTIVLPFAVSRWFDIFLGPLHAFSIYAAAVHIGRVPVRVTAIILLVFTLCIGLIQGIMAGLSVYTFALFLTILFIVISRLSRV